MASRTRSVAVKRYLETLGLGLGIHELCKPSGCGVAARKETQIIHTQQHCAATQGRTLRGVLGDGCFLLRFGMGRPEQRTGGGRGGADTRRRKDKQCGKR